MSDCLIDLINELKNKCIEKDCAFYEQKNISPAEFQFFVASLSLKRIDTNKIAKNMGISMSRISRVVDKMVNNGYIDRKADVKDRRAIKISFTNKGRKVRDSIANYRLKCEQKILANLSAKQSKELTGNLLILLENM